MIRLLQKKPYFHIINTRTLSTSTCSLIFHTLHNPQLFVLVVTVMFVNSNCV